MADEEGVKAWVIAAHRLKEAKETELNLRVPICEQILDGKIKGAKKGSIGRFTLTATAKINNKVDAELLKVGWEELTPSEKACIKYTPSLIAEEYNKLKGVVKLHRYVDSKPGTPSLAVKGGSSNGN